jgi:hypothetical protein
MTSISPSPREVVRTSGKGDKLDWESCDSFVTGPCFLCSKQYTTVMYNSDTQEEE